MSQFRLDAKQVLNTWVVKRMEGSRDHSGRRNVYWLRPTIRPNAIAMKEGEYNVHAQGNEHFETKANDETNTIHSPWSPAFTYGTSIKAPLVDCLIF